ncbi:unnamed protein product [Orchesella dallaii]|uniref:Uncharacterized protein n=1 Tax=Orchesella dallaii TaxID=48710 RepID=A0ABP1QIT6_9HEXA
MSGLGKGEPYKTTPKRYVKERPRWLIFRKEESDTKSELGLDAGKRVLTISYAMTPLTHVVIRHLAFNIRNGPISTYTLDKVRFMAGIQSALLRPLYFWWLLDRLFD